jgi:hypothetical protein
MNQYEEFVIYNEKNLTVGTWQTWTLSFCVELNRSIFTLSNSQRIEICLVYISMRQGFNINVRIYSFLLSIKKLW